MKSTNTMIFATWEEDDGQEYCDLFYGWEEFNKAFFNPEKELCRMIPFSVKGKTYKERQASLRDTAVEWSNAFMGGLYMSDLANICEWFCKRGRQLGLMREFRENAIC